PKSPTGPVRLAQPFHGRPSHVLVPGTGTGPFWPPEPSIEGRAAPPGADPVRDGRGGSPQVAPARVRGSDVRRRDRRLDRLRGPGPRHRTLLLRADRVDGAGHRRVRRRGPRPTPDRAL